MTHGMELIKVPGRFYKKMLGTVLCGRGTAQMDLAGEGGERVVDGMQ
jgi:hypothetical protein